MLVNAWGIVGDACGSLWMLVDFLDALGCLEIAW